ncbi:hypothetical protein RA210_U250043 [Rubrivivax sp. A210]|uniref:hypothetical protein n=1 Tax=Rubrivivax sp. A210 TaxID=2772301 RepID=UPI00191AC4F0|nr:hypothetical protein [Rubrivivax sp. A210]CAD5372944.1 hypothetical protein RA210_U250043 [Rubrivivax sp. A210]
MNTTTGELLQVQGQSWLCGDYHEHREALCQHWEQLQREDDGEGDATHVAANWLVLSQGLSGGSSASLGILRCAEPVLRRSHPRPSVALGLNLLMQASLSLGPVQQDLPRAREGLDLLLSADKINSLDAELGAELLATLLLGSGQALEAMRTLDLMLPLHLGTLFVEMPPAIVNYLDMRANVLRSIETSSKDLACYRTWPIANAEEAGEDAIEATFARAATLRKAGRQAEADHEIRLCMEFSFAQRGTTSKELRSVVSYFRKTLADDRKAGRIPRKPGANRQVQALQRQRLLLQEKFQ